MFWLLIATSNIHPTKLDIILSIFQVSRRGITNEKKTKINGLKRETGLRVNVKDIFPKDHGLT